MPCSYWSLLANLIFRPSKPDTRKECGALYFIVHYKESETVFEELKSFYIGTFLHSRQACLQICAAWRFTLLLLP